MGAMKRYVEDVSVDMGLDGEITDDVVAEAQRQLFLYDVADKDEPVDLEVS